MGERSASRSASLPFCGVYGEQGRRERRSGRSLSGKRVFLFFSCFVFYLSLLGLFSLFLHGGGENRHWRSIPRVKWIGGEVVA